MTSHTSTSLAEAQKILNQAKSENWRVPSKMIMVTPDHFRVDYAINPYMTDTNGKLQVIKRDLASAQWRDLKTKFEDLGVAVSCIEGDPSMPDMVFAANQSFVFWHNQEPNVLLSRMRSPHRRMEVPHFESWYRANNYKVHTFESSDIFFEGNGDGILDPKHRLVWGGIGPRSNQQAYREMSKRFDLPIITLPLVCADFYHLDTCFSILSPDIVAIQTRAFSQESLKIIGARFPTVIEIDYEENLHFFAANCHVINHKNVVLQKGASQFVKALTRASLSVHEVETSEYLKSGGSVFCMKMMAF